MSSRADSWAGGHYLSMSILRSLWVLELSLPGSGDGSGGRRRDLLIQKVMVSNLSRIRSCFFHLAPKIELRNTKKIVGSYSINDL